MTRLIKGYSVTLYRNSPDGLVETVGEGWSEYAYLHMENGFVSFHPHGESHLTTVYFGLDLFDKCIVTPIYEEKEA